METQARGALTIGPKGLALAEQLVLASIRTWARARLAGDDPRELVRSGVSQVASDHAAWALVALMEHVEAHATRRLCFHGVACPGYSWDEQKIVVASGVAQIAPDLARRLLGDVVRGARTCAVLARALNAALEQAGYPLPARIGGAPDGVTLH